jgi:hypothetical protein
MAPRLRVLTAVAVALALLATGPAPVRAQEADVAADASSLSEWWANEPWRFNALVYGWAPNIPVEIDAGPVSAQLPIRLPTLLDDLQGGFMGELQVHKGRVGAYVAPLVMFLRDTEHKQGPIQRHKITIRDDAYLTDFGLSYEVGQWQLSQHSESPTVTVEPFAGARWLIDSFDIKIKPGPTFDPELDFLTPVVGLRTLWDWKRWHLRAEGDYGGWDVDHVKETWNLLGAVAYRFHIGEVPTKVFVGYRYLRVRYEYRAKVRATIRGPLAGMAFEF